MQKNNEWLFDSMKKLSKTEIYNKTPPKSVLLYPTNKDAIKAIFPTDEIPNGSISYQELLTKNEAFFQHLKEVERENLELKRRNLSDFERKQENLAQKVEFLELENLRISEENLYLQEMHSSSVKEIEKIKGVVKEKEGFIEELKNKKEVLTQELGTFLQNNKKLEEQLKISNQNFSIINRKSTVYEKENMHLSEKLSIIEKDKRNLSLKWQKSSEKLKKDLGNLQKLKETETLLFQKTKESQDFKEKYINCSLELRLLKESEIAYKNKIDKKFTALQEEMQNKSKVNEEKQESSVRKSQKNSLELEDLLKENGELFKNLNECTVSLQNYREKIEDLEKRLHKTQIELEIVNKKSEVLNQENEKLHISCSQLINDAKSEKNLFDSMLQQENEHFSFENLEENLEFMKKSRQYIELSQSIADNSNIRSKLDHLILFIEENHPFRKDLIKTKRLYERLMIKYHNLQKNLKKNEISLENSKSTNTNYSGQKNNNLFNSIVSMTNNSNKNPYFTNKIQRTLFDEQNNDSLTSLLKPKVLFGIEKKENLNKSFDLDPDSCKKYHCNQKEKREEETIGKKKMKVNLSTFLTQNKPNSYLVQYLTKKN